MWWGVYQSLISGDVANDHQLQLILWLVKFRSCGCKILMAAHSPTQLPWQYALAWRHAICFEVIYRLPTCVIYWFPTTFEWFFGVQLCLFLKNQFEHSWVNYKSTNLVMLRLGLAEGFAKPSLQMGDDPILYQYSFLTWAASKSENAEIFTTDTDDRNLRMAWKWTFVRHS